MAGEVMAGLGEGAGKYYANVRRFLQRRSEWVRAAPGGTCYMAAN